LAGGIPDYCITTGAPIEAGEICQFQLDKTAALPASLLYLRLYREKRLLEAPSVNSIHYQEKREFRAGHFGASKAQ
jgi:hypothetical protein